MTSYTGNPEIDRELEKALAGLDQLEELQRRLADWRTEGYDPEGLVRVEVGPTGNLLDLALDPRAMRLDSQSLAEAILAAAQSATAKAAQEINELVEGLLPSDSGFGDMMTGSGMMNLPSPRGGGSTSDPIGDVRALLNDLRREAF